MRGRSPGAIVGSPCGASAIKCCYAAAGSGTGAEETGLRAPVSRKISIRSHLTSTYCQETAPTHKGIVVAKKMSRKVERSSLLRRQTSLHSRSSDLTSELQSSVRSDEVRGRTRRAIVGSQRSNSRCSREPLRQ